MNSHFSKNFGVNGTMSAVNVESGKATGGAGGAAGNGEDGMNDLYKVNQVWYRMLPTLSLVSKRTLLVNQSQSSSYQSMNNSVIFNISTGEFYTAMSTSYLFLQCGFRNAAQYSTTKALISQGNILSLIEEIIFTSASGTECERQTNKGLHSAVKFRWTHDQLYIDTIGQNQGAPYGPYFRIHDGVTPAPPSHLSYLTGTGYDAKALSTQGAGAIFPFIGGTDGVNRPISGTPAISQFGYGVRANLNVYSTQVVPGTGVAAPAGSGYNALNYPDFLVSLDQVLGIFKPYMNCLFPAGLLSGGRLEIRWKQPNEAFQFVGTMQEVGGTTDAKLANLIADAAGAFTVQSAYLMFDAFQLQDNVLKRLNQTAAGPDGLSMLFDTYDHVVTNFQGTGSCESQVSQARSRVIRSFGVVRDNALINNPYVNSFASEAGARRITGKIRAGVQSSTALVPVVISAGVNDYGVGGGYTPMVLLAGSITGATASTTPLVGTYPEQPLLPDDYYGVTNANVSPNNSWGRPMVSSFQVQLGALFFPQQPLTTLKEHYENALYMFGMGIPDSTMNSSVTLEDFAGGLGNNLLFYNNASTIGYPQGISGTNTNPTDPTEGWKKWVAPYGLAVYGALMEKSQALQLSGLPISNARLLRLKWQFDFITWSGTRQISTFTEFTRVVKVFLGGRVVVRE